MNYKSFNLGDWIGHISGVIEDETTLDGNEMRDLVEFLSTLEREPCEDAISRQAVLDLIADYDLSMGQVVRGIHALSSVTPKQKMGRWIDTDNYYRRWKCSECGYHTRDEEPNYCPYCGAKMVEPQESEDKE